MLWEGVHEGWHPIIVTASAGGVLTALLAASAGGLWWNRSRQLQKHVLKVTRVHTRDAAPFKGGADLLSLARFLDLDPTTAQGGTWSRVPLVSASQYLTSLRIPDGFNWRRALQTLLVHFRLNLLLPATDFLPVHSAEQRSGVVEGVAADDEQDPLAAIGGSRSVYHTLRGVMSPLHLYAAGELVSLVLAQNAAPLKAEERCTTLFLAGAPALPPCLESLPNPFILTEHLPGMLEGLDAGEVPAVVQPRPVATWLPDLALGAVGMRKRLNRRQERLSEILAVLLNRLACNSLPPSWRPAAGAEWRKTEVQLTANGTALSTPEGLILGLVRECGAALEVKTVSRTTGLGYGFAVREDETWKQVPFVLPVRTGVFVSDGVAASSGHDEVISLMSHAEVCCRGSIPGMDGASFRLSWYQGIEGFTGWHPSAESVQPWSNSAEMEVVHDTFSDTAELEAVMRATAVIASVTNAAADRMRLPKGGYGYLGVCNDSVATLQAALGKVVTQFPCILGGRAKAIMTKTYKEYASAARAAGSEGLASSAEQVHHALQQTPCDVVQEPTAMLDAARRIAALIPPVTPFRTLEQARGDLAVVMRQLREQGIHASKSAHAADQGAAARREGVMGVL